MDKRTLATFQILDAKLKVENWTTFLELLNANKVPEYQDAELRREAIVRAEGARKFYRMELCVARLALERIEAEREIVAIADIDKTIKAMIGSNDPAVREYAYDYALGFDIGEVYEAPNWSRVLAPIGVTCDDDYHDQVRRSQDWDTKDERGDEDETC